MDSTKTEPLTPEQAKERLRLAVDELGVAAWVKRRPYQALTIGLTLGMLLATSQPLRRDFIRMFFRVI